MSLELASPNKMQNVSNGGAARLRAQRQTSTNFGVWSVWPTPRRRGRLCRFQKLSAGADEVSVHQFEMIPELAGNPFLPRLFQMFDANKDSKLTQAEFNSAIDYFLKAQTPEDRVKCVSRATMCRH